MQIVMMQQQQQQLMQQQQPAPAAPAPTADPQQLMAMAMAQGYTAEQAQLYAQQYIQAQQAQAAAAAAAAPPPPPPPGTAAAAPGAPASASSAGEKTKASEPAPAEKKVALYANTPQILNIEEGRRRNEYRATLKAVLLGGDNGRRFNDVMVKGPWRRSRQEAQKDQDELSTAFKFDGEKGVTERAKELEDKEWTREELEAPAADDGQQADALEEDDFDAEAESEPENEQEVTFDQMELPVKVVGAIQNASPMLTWDEGVSRGCVAPAVRQALGLMMMERPTLIQRFALPLIANPGVDVLAQAQTGSGKTLAFVIPLVSRLVASPPIPRPYFQGQMAQASPVSLMLSPTRELAIQTSKNVSDLLRAAGSPLTVLTMYGGETLSMQCAPIERHNMDIICATPGRLLDAIDSGKVSLSFAGSIVLDEADQMLDFAVGLEGTVTQVIDGRDLPRNDGRQTLLFSATMPDFQTKQFHALLKKPPLRVKLRVGHYSEDEKGGSCRHISQTLIRVRDMDDRWKRLGRDLMEMWGSSTHLRQGKGIIFTNRIALASPIESALRRFGISAGQLHGKQTQDMREDVVNRFRKGEYEMLIASNVASRGLDFPDIRIVVQFELPKTVEIYTHRIGRTGRNGQSGMAMSYFWDVADKWLSPKLSEFLALNDQRVPGWLDDLANPDQRRRSRSRSRDRRRGR
mmetsp:Transcript_8567/g.13947  ORF Transcript_8567/g.13947 Transcript_8567/m.13947 type:complete len:689 (+) Transcript_8567:1-2067(+)